MAPSLINVLDETRLELAARPATTSVALMTGAVSSPIVVNLRMMSEIRAHLRPESWAPETKHLITI